MEHTQVVTGGWSVTRIADPCKLRTTCIQRLVGEVFCFSCISYLCIYYSFCVFFNTDLHNHSHPEAAIFKTGLCSFCKVLVQRQKSENTQIFSSFLGGLGLGGGGCQDTQSDRQTNLLILTIDMVLQGKAKNYLRPFSDETMGNSPTEALRFKRLQPYILCLKNKDLNSKEMGTQVQVTNAPGRI